MSRHRPILLLVWLLTTAPGLARRVHADEPAIPAAAPPPYSLGWQLRPVAAASVVRSDTSVAMYDDATERGLTVATVMLLSYRLTPALAPLVRFAVVHNTPPAGEAATSASNPLLGVTWAPRVLAPPLRLAVLAAVSLPLGSGGGDSPDMAMQAANRSGVMARAAMDNALFAVNDVGLIGGIDLAYVDRGVTVQLEATVFELLRARGGESQPDRAKTNFTSGIHAGYFVLPRLSVGAELRYQRYLTTPSFVEADPTGASRDTLSAAIGVRGHIRTGGKRWVRPGISYGRGLDDPMTGRSYQVIQVDIPFAY